MLCKIISDLSYTQGFKTNIDYIYDLLSNRIDLIKHLKDFKGMRENPKINFCNKIVVRRKKS